MITYPTSLDPADFGVILGIVTGNPPSIPHAIHAVLDLSCYAAGQLAADNMKAATPLSPTEQASFAAFDAEAWVKDMAAGKKMAGKINWANVLAFVAKLWTILGPLILKPAPVVLP